MGKRAPSALFNKDFVLLWQGQFVSQMGTQAFMIAMLLWLQETTGSATLVGLVLALASTPGVLLGPFAGALADRYSRRNLIVGADAVSGVAVLALAYLFHSWSAGGPVAVTGLCVAAVLVGICSSVFQPALAAAIPDLVPARRISAANSLIQSSVQVATLAAQGLGGMLYRLIGAKLLILANGLSYLFSAVSETFISIPPVGTEPPPERAEGAEDAEDAGPQEPPETFLAQVAGGVRYVWRVVGLRLLFFAMMAVRFFVVPFTVLLPFYVADTLGARPDWFGYLIAAFGVGVMVGYAVSGMLAMSGARRSWSILAAMFVMSACLGALGLTSSTGAALALFFGAGVMNGFISVQMVTILQVTTAGPMRGRVFGLARTVGEGLAPVAMLLTGLVGDLAGRRIQPIYAACGGILMLLAVVLALQPDLRRFLAAESERPETEAASAAEAGPSSSAGSPPS